MTFSQGEILQLKIILCKEELLSGEPSGARYFKPCPNAQLYGPATWRILSHHPESLAVLLFLIKSHNDTCNRFL